MKIYMTKKQYAAVHKDFKGKYDGMPTVMRMIGRGITFIAVDFAGKLAAGQKVRCNGYEGRVTKVCDGQLTGMAEVRLAGGIVCVDITDLIILED